MIKGCAANITVAFFSPPILWLLIMLHLCNGAANIKKSKILVPSVSFTPPNGGKVLIPQLVMVQTHALNKKVCQFYVCNDATMLAATIYLGHDVLFIIFGVNSFGTFFAKFLTTLSPSPHVQSHPQMTAGEGFLLARILA